MASSPAPSQGLGCLDSVGLFRVVVVVGVVARATHSNDFRKPADADDDASSPFSPARRETPNKRLPVARAKLPPSSSPNAFAPRELFAARSVYRSCRVRGDGGARSILVDFLALVWDNVRWFASLVFGCALRGWSTTTPTSITSHTDANKLRRRRLWFAVVVLLIVVGARSGRTRRLAAIILASQRRQIVRHPLLYSPSLAQLWPLSHNTTSAIRAAPKWPESDRAISPFPASSSSSSSRFGQPWLAFVARARGSPAKIPFASVNLVV